MSYLRWNVAEMPLPWQIRICRDEPIQRTEILVAFGEWQERVLACHSLHAFGSSARGPSTQG